MRRGSSSRSCGSWRSSGMNVSIWSSTTGPRAPSVARVRDAQAPHPRTEVRMRSTQHDPPSIFWSPLPNGRPVHETRWPAFRNIERCRDWAAQLPRYASWRAGAAEQSVPGEDGRGPARGPRRSPRANRAGRPRRMPEWSVNSTLGHRPATQRKPKGNGSGARTDTTARRGDSGRLARSAQGPSAAHRVGLPPENGCCLFERDPPSGSAISRSTTNLCAT